LGAIRSAAQMVSYEVSIGLIIMNLLCVTGSLNLRTIVEFQEHIWFIIPFSPLFILFFVSSLAETNRTPFDLPEAEGELVAGFNVEYSSTSFALFFIGEYTNIFFMATLSVFFFFGGWLMPDLGFLIPHRGLNGNYIPFFVYEDMQMIAICFKIYLRTFPGWFACLKLMPQLVFLALCPFFTCYIIVFGLFELLNIYFLDIIKGCLYAVYSLKPFVVAIKINILVFFFLWVRASLPRYRYDQLIDLTWKFFMPLGFGFLISSSTYLIL